MVLKKMADESGLALFVSSAATTYEEIGNDIYPPMNRALGKADIPVEHRSARRTTRQDYDQYDYIIGMDQENMDDLLEIYHGDPDHKVSRLLEWCGKCRDVADPWYTRDFSQALADIQEGCEGIIRQLSRNE